MTIAHTPIESHETHSRRLLEHAEEQLLKGDRLQASEKAWGAVAHRLKAIAERRGWRYGSHADVNRVVGRLAREMREPRLNTLVSVAHSLHQNYYEDAMPEELIQHNIDDMREMLDTLARAA